MTFSLHVTVTSTFSVEPGMMVQKRVRFGTYSRISSKEDVAIYNNQQNATRAYGVNRGWDLTYEYGDFGVSGAKPERAGLKDALQDASRGKYDVLVMTSLSRMTREGVEAAFWNLRKLRESGAGWVFTEQPALTMGPDTHPMVRDILIAVLAALDEEFRLRVSRNTRAAYARKKALADSQGLKVKWGRPPRLPKPPAQE